MRGTLTLITALVGVALATAGVLLALPKTTPNPHALVGGTGTPFGAGMFLIGIMVLFFSAVVYNVVKTR